MTDPAATKSPSYDALLLMMQSVCGALDRAGLDDCDDPGEAIDVIREKYERRIAVLESTPAAPVDSQHVECRQCDGCNHAGINDSSDQLAACLSCEWSGNSPDEDRCQECDKTGCMGAACPKCGARYTLIAEAELKVSATEAPGIDEAKLRKALRQARIQQLYIFEKSEIDSLVLELCDTPVGKVGIDACAWAGDGEGNWHTACGEIFTLMEGSPADNKMHHCPYCGKSLRGTGADVCGAVIGASYEDTRSEAHDAARYRWLRNHYEPSFHDSECDSLIGLHGEDLDDAIDDEMQATSADASPKGGGDAPLNGEVLVTVSGFTGSGKSAVAGEIEILCKALGLEVEWVDSEEEKRLTHADWTSDLELYKPRVRIVERNIPRPPMPATSAEVGA